MKSFLKIIFVIIICIGILVMSGMRVKDIHENNNKYTTTNIAMLEKVVKVNTITNNNVEENSTILLNVEKPIKTNRQVNDWKLVLVNFEHALPENFEIELANIDNSRQFDKRAIDELNQLLKDAKNAKIGNLWVQSSYRSPERQEELFNNKVKQYMSYGKTREEAEKLTRQFINESNTSEHNLGLAVDFNNVKKDFEKTKAFEWLRANAENYGFVLRYAQEKEDITKVSYEPWHWRYVGVEHAQKMNEMGICLEEYIEFLENNN
ncbi:MAG: M15 family metallopeptidase [Clostridia bacterium]